MEKGKLSSLLCAQINRRLSWMPLCKHTVFKNRFQVRTLSRLVVFRLLKPLWTNAGVWRTRVARLHTPDVSDRARSQSLSWVASNVHTMVCVLTLHMPHFTASLSLPNPVQLPKLQLGNILKNLGFETIENKIKHLSVGGGGGGDTRGDPDWQQSPRGGPGRT